MSKLLTSIPHVPTIIQCPRCKGQMLFTQSEDGPVYLCIQCGNEKPIKPCTNCGKPTPYQTYQYVGGLGNVELPDCGQCEAK